MCRHDDDASMSGSLIVMYHDSLTSTPHTELWSDIIVLFYFPRKIYSFKVVQSFTDLWINVSLRAALSPHQYGNKEEYTCH